MKMWKTYETIIVLRTTAAVAMGIVNVDFEADKHD